MAKLPSFRRLFKQDYAPEYQNLIDRLSGSLNYGIEVLYDTLNGKITLDDNIAATTRTVSVEVDTNGLPKANTTFNIDTTGAIKGLVVLNAVNNTNPATYPDAGIFVSFQQTSQRITIKHIAGLPANNQFSLTIVAFA